MVVQSLDHYLEMTPEIMGGKPRIAGRRIAVQNIVIWHERIGLSADEIATQFSLTLAEIYAALAYYHNNPHSNENKFMKFLVINNVAFCIKYLYNIIPYIIDVFNNEWCILYDDDCFMFRSVKLTKLYSDSSVNRHVIRDKFRSNNYFDDNNIDIFSINSIINRIDTICNSKKMSNKKWEFDNLRKVVYNYFASRITNKISVFTDKKNLSIDMIKNINLYENYIKLYETFDISLKEELVRSVFQPRRLSYYLDNYNFDINEHF